MSNFGIKQSFRSQAIARKFARTSVSHESSDNSNEEKENVFEVGNNTFASSVLNKKNGTVQISSVTPRPLSSSNTLTQDEIDKPINRKFGNARLLHMKNYNKAVTKSADHM